MSFQVWVLIHLVGVVGFAASHGVSMAVSFRLRSERDPAKINALLDASSRSITPLYISLLVLLAGGVGAAFSGRLWGFGWIWVSIATLVIVIGAMYGLATSYYKRVRVIAQAMEEGTEAVTPERFDEVLRSGRPLAIIVIGIAGLAFILYLMVMKPTLGLAPSATPPGPGEGGVEIAAVDLAFTTDTVAIPAGEPFAIVFDNRDAGVPHNVAIYTDETAAEALFVGETFPGPRIERYEVPALDAGSLFFRCDVHPATMVGTLEAG